MMEAGLPLPRPLERNFPPDLLATPIEDIDPYYADQPVSKLKFYVIEMFKLTVFFLLLLLSHRHL